MGPLHSWFWCRRRIICANRMPLSRSLRTRISSGRMLHYNCRRNTCRLLDCHHCRSCCVWCRRCGNCHGRLNFVGILQRRIEFRVIQAPLCFRYYSIRLITTMWFEWCHCHCCWAWRRLPFAMVHLFGVANGVEKEVCQTTCIYTVKESRVFFCPYFYSSPVEILR
jgi:hypothetical protein